MSRFVDLADSHKIQLVSRFVDLAKKDLCFQLFLLREVKYIAPDESQMYAEGSVDATAVNTDEDAIP